MILVLDIWRLMVLVENSNSKLMQIALYLKQILEPSD